MILAKQCPVLKVGGPELLGLVLYLGQSVDLNKDDHGDLNFPYLNIVAT